MKMKNMRKGLRLNEGARINSGEHVSVITDSGDKYDGVVVKEVSRNSVPSCYNRTSGRFYEVRNLTSGKMYNKIEIIPEDRIVKNNVSTSKNESVEGFERQRSSMANLGNVINRKDEKDANIDGIVLNTVMGGAYVDSVRRNREVNDVMKKTVDTVDKEAPLFGAKKQPKPKKPVEPKVDGKIEEKLQLDEALFMEGAGAGYTVSGTIKDVKIRDFEVVRTYRDVVNSEYDIGFYLTEIALKNTYGNLYDIKAYSYYYGGEVPNSPAEIRIKTITLQDAENPESLSAEDIRKCLDGVEIKCSIGGGWSHTTFDGELDNAQVERDAYGDYYVANVSCAIDVVETIYDIDDLVTGEMYYDEYGNLRYEGDDEEEEEDEYRDPEGSVFYGANNDMGESLRRNRRSRLKEASSTGWDLKGIEDIEDISIDAQNTFKEIDHQGRGSWTGEETYEGLAKYLKVLSDNIDYIADEVYKKGKGLKTYGESVDSKKKSGQDFLKYMKSSGASADTILKTLAMWLPDKTLKSFMDEMGMELKESVKRNLKEAEEAEEETVNYTVDDLIDPSKEISQEDRQKVFNSLEDDRVNFKKSSKFDKIMMELSPEQPSNIRRISDWSEKYLGKDRYSEEEVSVDFDDEEGGNTYILVKADTEDRLAFGKEAAEHYEAEYEVLEPGKMDGMGSQYPRDKYILRIKLTDDDL